MERCSVLFHFIHNSHDVHCYHDNHDGDTSEEGAYHEDFGYLLSADHIGNIVKLKHSEITLVKNLKVAYNNNSLRRLLGLPSQNSPSGMFVNLNITSFEKLLRKYVYNFRNKLETSVNVIIRGIYLSHFLLQYCIWD